MVYLVIKELANTAEDVIMVTSSVMKDVSGAGGRAGAEQDIYRANAIRALCRIIDVSRAMLYYLIGDIRQSYHNPTTSHGAIARAISLSCFNKPVLFG